MMNKNWIVGDVVACGTLQAEVVNIADGSPVLRVAAQSIVISTQALLEGSGWRLREQAITTEPGTI